MGHLFPEGKHPYLVRVLPEGPSGDLSGSSLVMLGKLRLCVFPRLSTTLRPPLAGLFCDPGLPMPLAKPLDFALLGVLRPFAISTGAADAPKFKILWSVCDFPELHSVTVPRIYQRLLYVTSRCSKGARSQRISSCRP